MEKTRRRTQCGSYGTIISTFVNQGVKFRNAGLRVALPALLEVMRLAGAGPPAGKGSP